MIILFYYYPSIHGLPSLPSSGGVGALIAANHPLHTVTGVPLLDALLTGNFAYFDSSFAHMIMPAVTLSIFPMGYIIATVKSNTIRILSEDNVFLLRASGMSWRRILFVHALKNNLVYLFTLAGLLFSSLLGTTVVVERIFGWPGLGSWAANSILSADVAGVLGFTTVVSLAFILTSLAIDLIYPLIDPRIGAQN
jgi:peptide/nickel transport system permease protein